MHATTYILIKDQRNSISMYTYLSANLIEKKMFYVFISTKLVYSVKITLLSGGKEIIQQENTRLHYHSFLS